MWNFEKYYPKNSNRKNQLSSSRRLSLSLPKQLTNILESLRAISFEIFSSFHQSYQK